MKIILEKTPNSINTASNYIICADESGSMWSAIKSLKDTLKATKALLGPQDTISIGWFSGYNKFDWIVKGATITANFDNLIEQNVYARGATHYEQILKSLDEVIHNVSTLTGHNNTNLLFLTDGFPNDRSSERDILSICKGLNGKFASAKIIGYSGYYNRKLLLDMAEAIGGQMSHISDHYELDKDYKTFFENRVLVKNVSLDKKYDLVWQVNTKDILLLTQKADNSVDVQDNGEESELFAIDYAELKGLTALDDAKFVYSLVYILSQKNKANLGVQLLRTVGDYKMAQSLRKAFTVAQKGAIENMIRTFALLGGTPVITETPNTTKLETFLEEIDSKDIYLDTTNSDYTSISRKGTNISKVEWNLTDEKARIIQVVPNENRPNISLLTVRQGEITNVTDAEFASRINEFNKTAANPITFPIKSTTYRNYSLVANGDFNFKKLILEENGQTSTIYPDNDLDIFDEDVKSIHIKDFVNLNKTLIKEKAHVSTLNFFIKQNSEQKHAEDWRVSNYGTEGAKLLEEMGIDYAGRYSPKKESIPVAEDGDYLEFLEIDGYIKGASTVSASASFKKWEKKAKPNAADELLYPLFEKYTEMQKALSKELFVEMLQGILEGVQRTTKILSRKLAAMKFYLATTNSWFDGIDKADEFEYDGFVVKVKTAKEYI